MVVVVQSSTRAIYFPERTPIHGHGFFLCFSARDFAKPKKNALDPSSRIRLSHGLRTRVQLLGGSQRYAAGGVGIRRDVRNGSWRSPCLVPLALFPLLWGQVEKCNWDPPLAPLPLKWGRAGGLLRSPSIGLQRPALVSPDPSFWFPQEEVQFPKKNTETRGSSASQTRLVSVAWLMWLPGSRRLPTWHRPSGEPNKVRH